uniref:Zinc finger PHD-type domain-containing protein n=1 Tax=Amphimedon queenslandica TaxID=400682 RepID=A0A1X7TZC5_AMPQE
MASNKVTNPAKNKRLSYGPVSTSSNNGQKVPHVDAKKKPPGSRGKAKQTSRSDLECICPICEDPIIDSSQLSIMCEGKCAAWLHRGCAGLSRAALSCLDSSPLPFLCPHCRLEAQSAEIESLRSSLSAQSLEIVSLQNSITSLTEQIDALSSSLSPSPNNVPSSTSHPRERLPPQSRLPPSLDSSHHRFNIIVSGIEESPVGTPRTARINSDINAASAILSDFSTDGTPPVYARDCRRLGRYRQDAPSPRPLLVTLNSTIEVSNVLFKCQRLSLTSKISSNTNRDAAIRYRDYYAVSSSIPQDNSVFLRISPSINIRDYVTYMA